jgi:hypothetical protein
MNHAYALTHASGSSSGALRVLGAAHSGRTTTSRAGTALSLDADGTYLPATADAPRFVGVSRRLLVEGARTNALRNARAQGAAPGAPGTMPLYWSDGWAAGSETLISQVLGTGTEAGIPFLDWRLSGTPSSGRSDRAILFEAPTAIAAANGESWAASAFIKQVAGSTTGFSMALRILERNASGGLLASGLAASFVPGTVGPLSANRVSGARTLAAGTGVAAVNSGISIGYTAGTSLDVTLRIGLPQLEPGAFASSPILPGTEGPAAGTRAADLTAWAPPGGFGTQGTLVIKAMLPQIAPFGTSQGLWQIDDGTDQNRILLRNTSAGSAITGVVDAGGSTLATLAAGNMAAGVPFRAAFAWAPGSQALCLSGGTLQSSSAAVPPGLARLLVGHASGLLNRAAHGELELVEYRPARVADAMLQALANAA